MLIGTVLLVFEPGSAFRVSRIWQSTILDGAILQTDWILIPIPPMGSSKPCGGHTRRVRSRIWLDRAALAELKRALEPKQEQGLQQYLEIIDRHAEPG